MKGVEENSRPPDILQRALLLLRMGGEEVVEDGLGAADVNAVP